MGEALKASEEVDRDIDIDADTDYKLALTLEYQRA
jgi:hypothetical protein